MMAKFSGPTATVRPPQGPMSTLGTTLTHEGGLGFTKDAKTALFTLALTNMVGEGTFYESGADRDKRFADLVHEVAVADPAWLVAMLPWLRNEANMRSATIVAAAELVATVTGPVEVSGELVTGRQIIDRACVRADEPAEMLGYWLTTHGRKIPKPIKRGIADAAVRLYTERNLLKYDGSAKGIRFGDVIDLTHPKPKDDAQSALFAHAITRRHNRVDARTIDLPLLARAYALDATPTEERRAQLANPDTLADAGYTWERLAGWLPGGMDAQAWEAIIPSMGYMALLRNLRNFEGAGISKDTIRSIADRLADKDNVAKSRQFPFRFWSAFKNSGTIAFGPALEEALEHSVVNLPAFPGRTLVMVDTSGSMDVPISDRSKVLRHEIGALMGAAVARRGWTVDLVIYATNAAKVEQATSVLRTIQTIQGAVCAVGHGTNTWPAVNAAFDGHDRILVFTDMQDHPAHIATLPDVPVYVWDLSGYSAANTDLTKPNRYLFGGFTDQCFKMIPLLERGHDAPWPWEL